MSLERRVSETYTRVAKGSRGQSEVNVSTEGVCQRTDGQGYPYENGNEQRIDSDAENKQGNTEGDAFDFRKAKSALEREQRNLTKDFGNWKERDDSKKSTNSSPSPKHSKQPKRTNGRNQERHGTRVSQHEHKSTKKITKGRGKEQSIDFER